MSEYIFAEHQKDDELLRLRMIEEALDPITIGYLERSGIGAGWRCLELGAGAGSIMKWMGEVVGTSGTVVGVDKNASRLRDLSDPPFQVLEGDFLEIPLDEAFDLAHCRYVLIHNPASDEILRKLRDALKPGGWLIVEEPDFTSAKLLNPKGDCARQRVNNSICRMFEQMGLDPGYALALPERLAAQGLQIVEVDSRIHLARGGTVMARMMGASTRALAEKYIATGEADEEDIEEYIRNTENEQVWSVYYSTISVTTTKKQREPRSFEHRG